MASGQVQHTGNGFSPGAASSAEETAAAPRSDDELPVAMLAYASKMARLQERVLEQSGCGLTYRNFRMLVRIAQGRTTLTQIGSGATTSYAAISQAVGAIMDKGYAIRDRGHADKRESHLSITPEGRKAMAEASAVIDAFVDRLLGDIDPGEIEAFRRTLNKVLENVDSLAVEFGLRPSERVARK